MDYVFGSHREFEFDRCISYAGGVAFKAAVPQGMTNGGLMVMRVPGSQISPDTW